MITGRLSGSATLTGAITAPKGVSAALSHPVIKTQIKTITPGDEVTEVTPDSGYAGLSKVVVEAIPNNYGQIIFNGTTLMVI